MIGVLLAAASVPFASAGAYLAGLTAASGRVKAPAGVIGPSFDIIVPAHDEEVGITGTVASLRAMAYPPELYRVIVVADNCVDATVDRARDAGALVLERRHATHRGKGHALAHGFDASLRAGFATHIVVVDADTVVSPNLLSACAARFVRGAECVQASYGVRNPDATWRTRLMRLAFTLHHVVRSLGRERLGLSCGLRGNGMAFSAALLRRVPYAAFSIVEDIEYGALLACRGVRVWYASEASVLGEMPATAQAAASQRRRWEEGRFTLLRNQGPRLLAAACRGNLLALDVGADLLLPPLAMLAGAIALGGGVAVALVLRRTVAAPAAVGWIVAVIGASAYVFRGWQLSGAGLRGLSDLLWAPVYLAWKLLLFASPRRGPAGSWIRTRRAQERAPSPSHPSPSHTP